MSEHGTARRAKLVNPDFQASDTPAQNGRTIVITGSNGGLGLQSATVLARAGAEVVLACRNPERGQQALAQVSAAATGAEPVLVRLDLSDLSSVREAAEQIDGRIGKVDVLINNAGLMAIPFARTADGFEMQMGTNHLGHFALTSRLLPALKRAEAPRVVSLASVAHRQGRMVISDLNFEHRHYTRMGAYGQSKLACILFGGELARRAEASGSNILSVTVHPGVAATNLFDSMVPPIPGALAVTHFTLGAVGNSQSAGALSQLYAATMPDVQNDDYLGPDDLFGIRGPVTRCGRTRSAQNRKLAGELWDKSVELTGEDFAAL